MCATRLSQKPQNFEGLVILESIIARISDRLGGFDMLHGNYFSNSCYILVYAILSVLCDVLGFVTC